MSDTTGEAAGKPASANVTAGRSFLSWKIIVPVAVALALGAGGAGYFFFLRDAGHAQQAMAPDPPMPFYLEVKPFVVSVLGDDGTSHFVQLGVNLQLSGSALGTLVTAVLPQVEDTLRLTALHFKTDEIRTPAGVDKLRAAMTAAVNQMLPRVLGADRIAAASPGSQDAVRNVYFSQLVIE